MLIDNLAVKVVNEIDYDFSKIQQGIDPVSNLGWIARCFHIDRTIRDFLAKRSNATIVNIGCGLDTAFWRVDNQNLYWFDLDLPDVIELRSKLLPKHERVKCIATSAFDPKWLSSITPADDVLFVSAGVLYYFEEPQIKDLFLRLSDAFPDSEIIFDATTAFGVKMSNKMVIKNSGMDEKAVLKWALKNAKDIERWSEKIKVLEQYPYFSNFKLKDTGILSRIKAWMFDATKASYMVHLKL